MDTDTTHEDALAVRRKPITDAIGAARTHVKFLRLLAQGQRDAERHATADDYDGAADVIEALVLRLKWEANL